MVGLPEEPEQDDIDGGSAPGTFRTPGGYLAEAALARFLLRQRRRREDLLGAHHFSDPIWDMMLDLFVAHVRGEEVATSSLIVAASVPQSTALRRIRRLVEDGDLIAWDDPHDGRRTFVRLSDDLFEKVGRFLQQWLAAQDAPSSAGRDTAPSSSA